MFSGFPHWGSRIGRGQRPNYGETTAVVLINTDLAVNGDSSKHVPPLRPYVAGSSGTINVNSHIATSYIEKVVCRMQRAQSAVLQRSFRPIYSHFVQREE